MSWVYQAFSQQPVFCWFLKDANIFLCPLKCFEKWKDVNILKNGIDALFCCVLPWFSFLFFPNSFLRLYLLEFPSVIFKMITCLVCKKLFSGLGDQFGCIFFYPLNHKVMGDIKVSNVYISVEHMKPPWNYICICLSHKYSYTYGYLTMQFQRNGAFSSFHLFFQKIKVKLKHWHETLAWKYMISGDPWV